MAAAREFVIVHDSGMFYNEHCRLRLSSEDPTVLRMTESSARMVARKLTCGDSVWGSRATLFADYGLATQREIGSAENGYFYCGLAGR